MSDMMFDQQHDARIGFGEATVNTRTSAKPAALRHKPSSRAQLVCQWHRSAQGPLTCTWTEVPLAPPGGARDLRRPDLAREDHFTCASRPESRLIQVLCPMNRGGIGARSLNIELQAALNPTGERKVEKFGWTFAPGDKVMQIENDYDKEVL